MISANRLQKINSGDLCVCVVGEGGGFILCSIKLSPVIARIMFHHKNLYL